MFKKLPEKKLGWMAVFIFSAILSFCSCNLTQPIFHMNYANHFRLHRPIQFQHSFTIPMPPKRLWSTAHLSHHTN